MAKKASSEDLRKAFTETAKAVRAKTRKAMKGLIEEAEEMMKEKGPITMSKMR